MSKAAQVQDYKPFRLRRMPMRAGPDKPGDWFLVEAKGNEELCRTGKSFDNARIYGGTCREDMQRLVDRLNDAWSAHFVEAQGGLVVSQGAE